MSLRLLREYISRALTEKAVSPEIAVKEGLALHSFKGPRSMRLILYSPADLIKGVKDTEEEFDGELSPIITNIGANSPSTDGHIYAYFVASKYGDGEAYNAWEVINASAIKGYGPMMYDIVMSLVGTIMSDRNSVSAMAKKVWSYYKNNRLDVKALPLDDQNDPKTPPTIDDAPLHSKNPEDPLNFAFKSDSSKIDVGALEARHNDLAAHLSTKLKISKGMVIDAIENSGEEFFRTKYHPNG
jgi:hypothetical protein